MNFAKICMNFADVKNIKKNSDMIMHMKERKKL